MSLIDIVRQHEADQIAHGKILQGQSKPVSSKSSLKIFEVLPANKYAPKKYKKRTVRIKIFDVLYQDQVCNLVYM